MKNPTIKIQNNVKMFRSPEFNYNFNLVNGFTETWGQTTDDEPEYCPYGNCIADIEISYGSGCPQTCKFCSPAGTLVNTTNGKNSIENIKPNDAVVGFDIQNNIPQIQTVQEIYCRDYDGELVTIETETTSLSVTPEHPIWTQNRGWVLAKNLNENDILQDL